MFNKYEHLSNGLTVLLCKNTKEKTVEEIYIDTKMFNYLSAYNVEWKVWDDNKAKKRSAQNPKVVGGTDVNSKKILFLKRVIGEYLHGDDYAYSLLNGDYFDLRIANIYNFKNGTGHSSQVKQEKQDLLKIQVPLQKKNDIDIITSNVDVKVVEYEGRFLFVKENAVVNELTLDQSKATINFFNTRN